ncbi:MAG: hypothetical protein ACI8Z5_000276 [Lentimonas sp.]|jgi:hypothetical protein
MTETQAADCAATAFLDRQITTPSSIVAWPEHFKQGEEVETTTGKKAKGTTPKQPKEIEEIAMKSQDTYNMTDREPYVSVSNEGAHNERSYDFCPGTTTKPKAIVHPTRLAMREKLASDEGKAIDKHRSQTVETVFGIIK